MKIGIISDVHGDNGALNRALAHFDADPEIALTLNAGDLVGRGLAQDEVVETIRARRIPSARGNHDECDYPLRRRASRLFAWGCRWIGAGAWAGNASSCATASPAITSGAFIVTTPPMRCWK